MLLVIAILTLLAPDVPAQRREPRDIGPVLSLHALNATVLALNVGVYTRPEVAEAPFVTPVVNGEAGIAGGQLSLGVGLYNPPNTDWGGPGSEVSLRLQGSVLRTWGDPFFVEPQQSFAGVELQVTLLLIGVRAGYWSRIAGTAPGDESFFSVGLVLGWQ